MRDDNRNHQEEEEGGAAPPPSKRLKSAEPDLAIICRFQGNEETIHCHSVIMASHSNYFDTLLSSGMQESVTKSVTLEDVDPAEFRLALDIAEDPHRALTASAEEIMSVAPLYNRFEFGKALKLSQTILGKYLSGWTLQVDERPSKSELNLIADIILFSQVANIDELINLSIAFINSKLSKQDMTGMGLFQESFIERIKPFLSEHTDACISEFYSKNYSRTCYRIVKDRKDFFTALYWDIYTRIDMEILADHDIRFVGKIKLGGSTVKHSVLIQPYQTTTAQIDGEAITCDMIRVKGSLEFDRLHIYAEADIGDWFLSMVVGRKHYIFVHPNSTMASLPPTGKGWRLLKSQRADDGTDPSFELALPS
jgi:hypothetical protein